MIRNNAANMLTKLLSNIVQIILNILILDRKVENKMNSQKYEKIILFDSSSKFRDLDKFIDDDNLIITFDYKSHTLLSQKNVKHTVSDTYLTTNEIASLQHSSYVYSKFFNDKKLSNSSIYKGIQLGDLFYIELYMFLAPFLKKFSEIQKIYERYSAIGFASSPNLVNLVELFTKNVVQINEPSQKLNFFYDHVKINFKISRFIFKVKIPQKYFAFIKNITDTVLRTLQASRFDNPKDLSLLIEFDTLKYNRLLEKTNNFIIYNQRKPTIWNIKSYKTVKKSDNLFVTNSVFRISEKNSKDKISNQVNEMLNLLLQNEAILISFFSLKNISFWKALKPYFIELCKNRFFAAIEAIDMGEQLFTVFRIKSILVWSESGFNELVMIQLGKKHHIQVGLMQHGFYCDTAKAKTLNEFFGVLPILSDKFLVWGESARNYALECGIPNEKIHIVGNPAFDDLFENKETNISNDYILLATQSPTNNTVNDFTITTIEKYEKTIKKICETVTTLNKNLVIKLHPDPLEHDITKLVYGINPAIKIIKKGNIYSLIKKCQVFIAIDISTSTLEAQILQKPTISISVKNDYLDEDNCSLFKSNSCVRTNIDNFENTLQRILSDANFKNELIQNGNKYVNHYLSNQGESSTSFSKLSFN